MPQYRVLQTSFIGNRIVQEGEVIDYDGETSENLEPVGKVAKKQTSKADYEARLSAAANSGDPEVKPPTEADAQDAERLRVAASTGDPEATVDKASDLV